jgi:hypothetical protein
MVSAAAPVRAALDAELARSLPELQGQGPEALRSHVQRLLEFRAALDLTHDVSPEERRTLADRILGRVAQVGLLIRDPAGHPSRNLLGQGGGPAARLPVALGSALDFVGESSILLVGLLGGVVVAYALGRLAGYRRGASQASYYGAGDPRREFVAAARPSARAEAGGSRMGIEQIRRSLADGRPVLLQLGYEVAPRRREEYLAAIREWQCALNVLAGPVHSVWEDPRRPHRFYEVVGCDRAEVLDLVTGDRGDLAALDARIEACWRPGRPVLRRAWLGAFREAGADATAHAAAVSAGSSREVRAA